MENRRVARSTPLPRPLLRQLATFVLLGSVLATAPAGAEPRDRAAADALFQAARDEFERGEYASACEKFAESNRLDPAPGTLLNLALCLEKIGKVASAWEGFRQVAEKLGDERVEFANSHSSALEDRLPWLTLRLPPGAPEGTRVFRDGIEIRAAALGVALPVDPGSHRIVVDAPGRLKESIRLSLQEGQREVITLRLGPEKPKPERVQGPARSAPDRAPLPAPDTDHTLAWITGGVGAAGVAASLVTGALAISSKRTLDAHCVADECDGEGLDAASSGRTYATISTVSGAVGFVGLGLSTYLFLSSDREQTPSTRMDATALPGGGYVGMTRRF